MLRTVDEWEGEAFAFRVGDGPQSPSESAVMAAGGAAVTILDAHLLFNADFARAGSDLVLHGDDGKSFVVRDYFAGDERARLFSPEGASLSPEVIAALAGPQAPGQVAQAAPAPAAAQTVGRVAKVEGGVTIVRNGIAIAPQTGDAVLKGDVLLTASGSLGVTFNDGSTLNLTANSRLVVNEFVYDPRGSANSQILDLVQGSLTFISGEVAHTGGMKIGTPVATMGIRGTVGGVTTANDGTVSFYIVQSDIGAVLTDQNGTVIAQVVQNGPLIVVRPVGPLQVLAQEVQKTPDQMAAELAALQHIVSVKAVGDQIVRQFFQADPTQPAPTDQPRTQIQIDLQRNNDTGNPTGPGGGGNNVPDSGNVIIRDNNIIPGLPGNNLPPIVVPIPPDLPPINFAPLQDETGEDTPLVFSSANENGISVFDADTGVLTVTLTATHGALTLNGVAGLTFAAGDGAGDAAMTFSGPRVLINAALNGLTFTPDQDYNGPATVTIVTGDGNSTTAPEVIDITVNAVNDAPVTDANGASLGYTENNLATAIDPVLTIVDIDSAMLVGAKVSVTGNFQAGQDVLGFVDQNGITGSYNAATGILTLSGMASLADYQTALRSVTYFNSSEDPSSLARTVSFQVDDGAQQNNLSNNVTATVTVTPVNDAPTIAGVKSTGALASGALTALAASYLTAGHDLIDNLGGASGFGEMSLAANDDSSTEAIGITGVFGAAGLNFFGTTYTSLYINNNGNITFTGPLSTFTPAEIDAGLDFPIIAPFWADVDTCNGPAGTTLGGNSTGSNLVWYDLDADNRVVTITWDDVGYFNQNVDALNAFQLQLIGRGYGNFDIVFRYEDINWTTGDASGGAPARAGYSAGDDDPAHDFELPQSGNAQAMLAIDTSANNSGAAGVKVFQAVSSDVIGGPAAKGEIAFADSDTADTHTAAFQTLGSNFLGTFALDNLTESNGNGTVAWQFSLTSDEFDSLQFNDVFMQSYDVTITDNHQASVTKTVTVSVGGPGADTFVFDFNMHVGADLIVNFDRSNDIIDLDGYGFDNQAELLAAIGSNGVDSQTGDAVVDLGNGDSITVAGVTEDYLELNLQSLIHLNGGQLT